jgi:hypothetical protein
MNDLITIPEKSFVVFELNIQDDTLKEANTFNKRFSDRYFIEAYRDSSTFVTIVETINELGTNRIFKAFSLGEAVNYIYAWYEDITIED